MIIVLEIAFRDPDHVVTTKWTLEILKQTNCNFSTYYAEFQCYATDIQSNDPTKHTTLMRHLNNEIKHALTLSDYVPQQFWEFITFLQQLNNQIRAWEAEKKGKPGLQTTNTML
jgi:hypothetical protein